MRTHQKYALRMTLFLVQNGCCVWCGRQMTFNRCRGGGPAQDFATFEHITPKANGGKLHPDNIVLACLRCNHLRNAIALARNDKARRRLQPRLKKSKDALRFLLQ